MTLVVRDGDLSRFAQRQVPVARADRLVNAGGRRHLLTALVVVT